MNKVSLLAVNARHVHSSLAVWLLSGGVTEYARLPHEVRIIETTIHQDTDTIAGQIAGNKPDMLGVSVYIWNAAFVAPLLDEIRKRLPGIIIILGGPEAAYNAAYWLTHGADYVLQGECERSFPALLDALAGGDAAALDAVAGLWRIKNAAAVHNPAGETAGVAVNPYTEAYFKALNGRIAYIETSRGCPFRCSFCLSGGSELRFFSLDEVKKQLSELSRSGAKTIKLVDRTFNSNASRAYELFEYIIRLDTPCRFHFETAADLFDERTLSLLSSAPPGRIQLEAGLQSFCEPALNAVSRRTDLEKAERNIKALLSGRNIHVHLDLIAGLPFETLRDFQESFNRAYALGAHTLQLGFLKLLHGSALREQALRLGISYNTEPPYEIIRSPWLGERDLEVLKQTENALSRTHNGGRFLSSLQYVLSAAGIDPFSLFRGIGAAAPNHGEQLDAYAGRLYEHCVRLPGVRDDVLRDHMLCDWLAAVKGKNLPPFLRVPDSGRKKAAAMAEALLGRKIERAEAAVLPSGGGRAVFADSRRADPVTGLYELRFITL